MVLTRGREINTIGAGYIIFSTYSADLYVFT